MIRSWFSLIDYDYLVRIHKTQQKTHTWTMTDWQQLGAGLFLLIPDSSIQTKR